MVNWGYKGFQGFLRGYKGLQGVRRVSPVVQGVKGGYKGL